MNRAIGKQTTAALVAGTMAVVGLTAMAQAAEKLIVNGKVASNDVRTVNGSAYVKLADVAKALGMVVVKRGGGYEMKKPGGAQQVGNMNGKVGDVLFDGKWRFQVREVTTVDSYTIKAPTVDPVTGSWDLILWDSTTRVMRPRPNHKLILMQCRVTNGQKEKQSLWTAPSDQKIHTALADTEGGSHMPAAYDYAGASIQTKPMLPGQVLNFALLFSVPQETQLKDLIFTLHSNNYDSPWNDVRVSLNNTP